MPLGSLLSPSWSVNGLSLTTYPYSVEMDGIDYGPPDLTTEILVSFLTRGDVENRSHVGNRTLTLPIMIEGQSLQAIAAAQGALERALDVPFGALVCDPGDGVAPAFQFVVFQGVLNFQHSSPGEMAGVRRYVLTFRAEPDVYSSRLTTVPALAASGSTTTNVDNGSSASGWTATVNGATVTPAVVSGAVRAQSGSAILGAVPVVMTRTGSIATASTPYLVVDWKIPAGTLSQAFSATADGVALTKVAEGSSPTAGYTRTTFSAPVSTVGVLALTSVTTAPGPSDMGSSVIRSLTVDNIDRSDVRPTLGTPAQQLRTFQVDGSAPTIGSLSVQHSTTALGDVLIYTCPDDGAGYVPACRNYRVSGPGPTTDTAAVSGAYDLIDTAVTYDVPVSSLPNGEYLVLIRAHTEFAPAALTWTVTPRLNGTNIGPTATFTGNVVGSLTYLFNALGMVHLPAVDVASSSSAVMRFTFVGVDPTADNIYLDELYLLNLTTGRRSQISCGTGAAAAGGPAKRLWIDSPSVANSGFGRYLVGHSADRSDAFYPGFPAVASEGVHEFPAGVVKVFTVTSNLSAATAADAAFAYYAAWSHHAAS